MTKRQSLMRRWTLEMDFFRKCGRLGKRRLAPIALILLLGNTVALGGSAPSPLSVEMDIIHDGASATLNRLYRNDTDWVAVLEGIASGQVEWLKVAKDLYAASDGATAEHLAQAAGEALEHDPTAVLSVLANVIGIEDICGEPDVDDARFDSYLLAIEAIRRRQRKLRTIREPRLIPLRNRCLSELDAAKLHIAGFYRRED